MNTFYVDENVDVTIKVQAFLGSSFQSKSYLLYNETDALIIDLGEAKEELFRFIRKHELNPQMILLTHAHIDHIAGIGSFYKEYEVPIYLHARDLPLYEHVDAQAEFFGLPKPGQLPEVTHFPEHGEYIHVLGSAFQVIETPGHTLGSLCFYNKTENMVFTGDTLFKGFIGRLGFPGSSDDPLEIIRSIENYLYCLPDGTQIYPGHMDYSTIGIEKQKNAFVRAFP